MNTKLSQAEISHRLLFKRRIILLEILKPLTGELKPLVLAFMLTPLVTVADQVPYPPLHQWHSLMAVAPHQDNVPSHPARTAQEWSEDPDRELKASTAFQVPQIPIRSSSCGASQYHTSQPTRLKDLSPMLWCQTQQVKADPL